MRVFGALAICLLTLYVLDAAFFNGQYSGATIEVVAQLRRAF